MNKQGQVASALSLPTATPSCLAPFPHQSPNQHVVCSPKRFGESSPFPGVSVFLGVPRLGLQDFEMSVRMFVALQAFSVARRQFNLPACWSFLSSEKGGMCLCVPLFLNRRPENFLCLFYLPHTLSPLETVPRSFLPWSEGTLYPESLY